MKIQHLVLDDDVHRALKAHKKKAGITVKEFGNSALRAALGIPTKEELIVEKLVGSGKITYDDYTRATAAADQELKEAQKRAVEAVTRDAERETWTVGSWEGREIYRSPDHQVQVVDHWARDEKKTPTPLIVHDESDVWAIVLAGEIHLQVGDKAQTLGPREMVHIRPGTPHVTAPLTRTARALLVFMPALPLAR